MLFGMCACYKFIVWPEHDIISYCVNVKNKIFLLFEIDKCYKYICYCYLEFFPTVFVLQVLHRVPTVQIRHERSCPTKLLFVVIQMLRILLMPVNGSAKDSILAGLSNGSNSSMTMLANFSVLALKFSLTRERTSLAFSTPLDCFLTPLLNACFTSDPKVSQWP